MGLKSKMIMVLLLATFACGATLSKQRLDVIRPESEKFQELMYVPEGRALKLITFGFDAPVADMLWVQGLVYYSDNIRTADKQGARKGRYKYLFKINNVITDLNPQFMRAYSDGGMFLLSTGQEKHVKDGIRLLEKGVLQYDLASEKGYKVNNEHKWRLLTNLAEAYDGSLRNIYIAQGNRMEAHRARRLALEYMTRATEVPGCPQEIILARIGLEQQMAGISETASRYDSMINVWKRIAEDKSQSSEELRDYAARKAVDLMKRRDMLRATIDMEKSMTAAIAQIRASGSPNNQQQDMLRKLLASPSPMDDFNDILPGVLDRWIELPGRGVLSLKLASLKASYMTDMFFDAIFDYYHKHKETFPPTLQDLVNDGIIDKVPRHPLWGAGAHFAYNRNNGTVSVKWYVRVAAIQAVSEFGQKESNRSRLKALVEKAAGMGAQIVVLPEAAIPGYADMEKEIYWADNLPGPQYRNVKKVAETASGRSFEVFSRLAKKYGIYVTVPIIERHRRKFYITCLLLSPDGKVAIHHRKQVLWTVADAQFATADEGPTQTANSPFGKIGLMICRDMHSLLDEYADKKVDIVLHSAAFFGPNFEGYLLSNKYTGKVKKGGFAVVLANWTTNKKSWWQGYGMSRIIDHNGNLVARAANKNDLGDEIVIGDLPLNKHDSTGR